MHHQHVPAPVKIPALTGWWIADRGALDAGGALASDGETVATWKDLAGTATNATQSTDANRPTYSSSTKSLACDATNDTLSLGNDVFTAPMTVYVVWKLNTDAWVNVIFQRTGAATTSGVFWVRFFNNGGGVLDFECNGSDGTTAHAAVKSGSDTTIGLTVCRLQVGSVVNQERNGTASSSAGTLAAFSPSGQPVTFCTTMNGNVYEIGYFQKYISAAELATLERYAKDKYGLSFTP